MKPKRGELYLLKPTGTGKPRPVVIVSNDELSLIDKLQIDLARGPIGQFDVSQMQRLMDALKWTLEIS